MKHKHGFDFPYSGYGRAITKAKVQIEEALDDLLDSTNKTYFERIGLEKCSNCGGFFKRNELSLAPSPMAHYVCQQCYAAYEEPVTLRSKQEVDTITPAGRTIRVPLKFKDAHNCDCRCDDCSNISC